ncbi:MAG: hypothetical protein C4326_07520 [Ignavibacteria bacterium]|mgnify:CR=1 FL=1
MNEYRVHRVTSLEIPQLAPYRTLRRTAQHLQEGIFVAEGGKVVTRLLDSHWRVVSMLMTDEWFTTILFLVGAERLHGVDVFLAGKPLLESIVGFRLHQGIMAVGKLPAERSLHELLAPIPQPYVIVALDGLVHAENVGVVVRNCAAFGVDAILVSSTSASPYLRRAVRNSMGGVFRVPVLHVEHLPLTLDELKHHYAFSIIVADAHAERTLESADVSGNVCVVFGNEDKGVSEDVQPTATQRIRIPMHNAMDSLNVASASAVMLYEIRRRIPLRT